jgi:hypothetical protein
VDRLALRIEESIRPVLCVTLYIVISVFLMMHVERGHQGHQHGASAMIFVLLMLAKSRSRFTFVQHSLVCVGIGFAASLASQVLDGPDLPFWDHADFHVRLAFLVAPFAYLLLPRDKPKEESPAHST